MPTYKNVVTERTVVVPPAPVESPISAVSWGAILAGALAAAVTSIVLAILGSGLGLSVASPFGDNPAVTTVAIGALVWLIIIQWASSALGGYITGRLRTKWVNVHSDEVFFRDTAHGFLAWAAATLLVAVFVTSTSLLLTHGALQGDKDQDGRQNPNSYYVFSIYRTTDGSIPPVPPHVKEETDVLLARSFLATENRSVDRDRLIYLVTAHTGVSQDEAVRRVDSVIVQGKADAEKARKAGITLSIFTALAMAIGAFIASASAALAGRLRDDEF